MKLSIETSRLHLRRPLKEDVETLQALWRNEKVREFLGGIMADEIIEEKILALHEHWNKNDFGQWVVCIKNTGQIIGICGLHHSDDGIEISYMFFPEFWNQGFATEAVIASLDYGFKELKLDRIIAITQEANHSSCRLLEKVGMQHIKNLERFNATQRVYELTRTAR